MQLSLEQDKLVCSECRKKIDLIDLEGNSYYQIQSLMQENKQLKEELNNTNSLLEDYKQQLKDISKELDSSSNINKTKSNKNLDTENLNSHIATLLEDFNLLNLEPKSPVSQIVGKDLIKYNRLSNTALSKQSETLQKQSNEDSKILDEILSESLFGSIIQKTSQSINLINQTLLNNFDFYLKTLKMTPQKATNPSSSTLLSEGSLVYEHLKDILIEIGLCIINIRKATDENTNGYKHFSIGPLQLNRVTGQKPNKSYSARSTKFYSRKDNLAMQYPWIFSEEDFTEDLIDQISLHLMTKSSLALSTGFSYSDSSLAFERVYSDMITGMDRKYNISLAASNILSERKPRLYCKFTYKYENHIKATLSEFNRIISKAIKHIKEGRLVFRNTEIYDYHRLYNESLCIESEGERLVYNGSKTKYESNDALISQVRISKPREFYVFEASLALVSRTLSSAFRFNGCDLVRLTVNHVDFSRDSASLGDLAYLIEQLSLRHLDLSFCSIDDSACKRICDALNPHRLQDYQVQRTIEVLNLSHNSISSKAGIFLANVFIKGLSYDDSFADNSLLSSQVLHSEENLNYSRSLTRINTQRNLSSSLRTKESKECLTERSERKQDESFQSNPLTDCLIESLCLSSNSLNSNGLSILLQSLIPSRIRSLDLSDNSLNESDLTAVSEFLKQSLSIKSLDVSNNSRFSNESISHFGKALKECKSLKELNLSNINLNKDLSPYLFQYMTDSRLRALNLDGNSLGEIGGVLFANVIKANEFLKRASLRGTGLNSNSLICLAHAIEVNSSLESLLLNRNDFNDSSILQLKNALVKNSKLKVSLSRSKMSIRILKLIKESSECFDLED